MRRLLFVVAVLCASLAAILTITLTGQSRPGHVGRPPTPKPQLISHRFGSTPSSGQLLTESTGTWSNAPTSFAWQWEQCNATGGSCTNITGATGTCTIVTQPSPGVYQGNCSITYAVVPADVGHTIRIAITATNAQGAASVTSAASAVVTSPTGTITFNGDFEHPTATNAGGTAPWTNFQCANYGASLTTPHWPGNLYFDNGTSTPTSPGTADSGGTTTFNAAATQTPVPPGDGSYSARIVLPTQPSGTTNNHEYCTLHQPQTPSPGDLGTTKFYGLMFYIPPGDAINSPQFTGMNTWEMHIGSPPVWAAPIIWQLHTTGVSAVNGTASSMVLALETGACNNSTTASPGCQYRSNAGAPQCTITSAPNIGSVHCLPAEYLMPPGSVQYGAWNELVVGVDWESTATGSIRSWYKTKTSGTWTPAANVTGIPTIQYDVAKGCCGFPTGDDVEQYGGLMSAPESINIDDQLIGTSLAIVENALPTSGSTPTPPVNTAPPVISGSTSQGSQLTTTSSWSGSPTPSLTYQWQDCNSSGASCVTGQSPSTNPTYTLTSPDVGHTIRVVVTATNSAGTANATSAATAVVTAPSTSPGTGPSLANCTSTCTVGGWTQVTLTSVAQANPPSTRNVWINAPNNLACTTVAPCPLVVVFSEHALNPPISSDLTANDFANYAPTGRYVTVVMTAPLNGGFYTTMLFSHETTTCNGGSNLCDDTPELQAVLAYMRAHYAIDNTRIFATGGSKGGQMTENVACDPRVNATFAGFSAQSDAMPTATGTTAVTANIACPSVNGFTSFTADGWAIAPPIGTPGTPVPTMYQDVFGLSDTAYSVGALGCTYSNTLSSCPYVGYSNSISIKYTMGQKQEMESFLAPAWGCSSTATSTTVDTGVFVHTYGSCTTGPNNPVDIQNVSIPSSCHSDSCVGSAGYDLARGAWKFWTTGTSLPS